MLLLLLCITPILLLLLLPTCLAAAAPPQVISHTSSTTTTVSSTTRPDIVCSSLYRTEPTHHYNQQLQGIPHQPWYHSNNRQLPLLTQQYLRPLPPLVPVGATQVPLLPHVPHLLAAAAERNRVSTASPSNPSSTNCSARLIPRWCGGHFGQHSTTTTTLKQCLCPLKQCCCLRPLKQLPSTNQSHQHPILPQASPPFCFIGCSTLTTSAPVLSTTHSNSPIHHKSAALFSRSGASWFSQMNRARHIRREHADAVAKGLTSAPPPNLPSDEYFFDKIMNEAHLRKTQRYPKTRNQKVHGSRPNRHAIPTLTDKTPPPPPSPRSARKYAIERPYGEHVPGGLTGYVDRRPTLGYPTHTLDNEVAQDALIAGLDAHEASFPQLQPLDPSFPPAIPSDFVPIAQDPALPLCRTIIIAAHRGKADDIVALRYRYVPEMCGDAFVVFCHVYSFAQLVGVCDRVEKAMKDTHGVPATTRSGSANSGWLLLEFECVTLSVMTPFNRVKYALEGRRPAAEAVNVQYVLEREERRLRRKKERLMVLKNEGLNGNKDNDEVLYGREEEGVEESSYEEFDCPPIDAADKQTIDEQAADSSNMKQTWQEVDSYLGYVEKEDEDMSGLDEEQMKEEYRGMASLGCASSGDRGIWTKQETSSNSTGSGNTGSGTRTGSSSGSSGWLGLGGDPSIEGMIAEMERSELEKKIMEGGKEMRDETTTTGDGMTEEDMRRECWGDADKYVRLQQTKAEEENEEESGGWDEIDLWEDEDTNGSGGGGEDKKGGPSEKQMECSNLLVVTDEEEDNVVVIEEQDANDPFWA
eukprot:GHVS01064235.1.p1 GENE.GHVS01064235.1~~GHVS01064235.1.p1  ORF type:complete len:809 (+),score=201.33 GHVS01064235.1:90-2516(+)